MPSWLWLHATTFFIFFKKYPYSSYPSCVHFAIRLSVDALEKIQFGTINWLTGAVVQADTWTKGVMCENSSLVLTSSLLDYFIHTGDSKAQCTWKGQIHSGENIPKKFWLKNWKGWGLTIDYTTEPQWNRRERMWKDQADNDTQALVIFWSTLRCEWERISWICISDGYKNGITPSKPLISHAEIHGAFLPLSRISSYWKEVKHVKTIAPRVRFKCNNRESHFWMSFLHSNTKRLSLAF